MSSSLVKGLLFLLVLILAGIHFTTFTFVEQQSQTCVNDSSVFDVNCAFNNAEDIVRAPDGVHLIVSEFNGVELNASDDAGQLSLFNPENNSKKILALDATAINEGLLWGEANCKQPPQILLPHGIDITQRTDGDYQLFVVNHGSREAIEMYQYLPDNSIVWKGCVHSSNGLMHNDVAGLANGGFYASIPFAVNKDILFITGVKGAFLGKGSGYIGHWQPQSQYQMLDWTKGNYPNGIQVSADNRSLFVNYYFEQKTVKLDIEKQQRVAETNTKYPDNINWSQSGELLVTTHSDYLLRLNSCLGKALEICPAETKVYSLNPTDLSKQLVFQSSGKNFGFGSTAIDTQGKLVVGTPSGSRIAISQLNAQ